MSLTVPEQWAAVNHATGDESQCYHHPGCSPGRSPHKADFLFQSQTTIPPSQPWSLNPLKVYPGSPAVSLWVMLTCVWTNVRAWGGLSPQKCRALTYSSISNQKTTPETRCQWLKVDGCRIQTASSRVSFTTSDSCLKLSPIVSI